MGFSLADGCVSERKDSCLNLKCYLKMSDREHLEKLKAALKYTGPITEAQGGTVACLSISSNHLCQSLCRLECYPRKTAVHGTPKIPEVLYRHL